MEGNGLRRKDTTKGPPLRILSLGKRDILGALKSTRKCTDMLA